MFALFLWTEALSVWINFDLFIFLQYGSKSDKVWYIKCLIPKIELYSFSMKSKLVFVYLLKCFRSIIFSDLRWCNLAKYGLDKAWFTLSLFEGLISNICFIKSIASGFPFLNILRRSWPFWYSNCWTHSFASSDDIQSNSCFNGVPKILNINDNCSKWLFPGNSSLRRSNSAKMQPTAHTSTDGINIYKKWEKWRDHTLLIILFSTNHNLRGSVPSRNDILGEIGPFRHSSGQSKVRYLDIAILAVYQNILRLQIAMNHSRRMDIFQSSQDLIYEE